MGVVSLLVGSRSSLTADPSASASKEVRFEVSFPGAREVAIAGDFNKWDTQQHLLQRTDGDTWVITLKLESGAYQYQFLVDGKHWKPDPQNPLTIPDGFGGINSGMEI